MMWINKTKTRRKLVKTAYRLVFSKGKYLNPQEMVLSIRESILNEIPFALGRIGVNEINAMLEFGGYSYPNWLRIDKEYVWKSLNVNVGVYPKKKKNI